MAELNLDVLCHRMYHSINNNFVFWLKMLFPPAAYPLISILPFLSSTSPSVRVRGVPPQLSLGGGSVAPWTSCQFIKTNSHSHLHSHLLPGWSSRTLRDTYFGFENRSKNKCFSRNWHNCLHIWIKKIVCEIAALFAEKLGSAGTAWAIWEATWL